MPLFQKDTAICILGLMSGTSLDGIDACAVHCQQTFTGFQWRIEGIHSGVYSPALKQTLLTIQQAGHLIGLQQLAALNRDIAMAFGQVAKSLIDTLQQQGITVDAIASHGQTVFHGPPTSANYPGTTLQLGEAAYIAELTGKPVISNFRSRDMAAYGQGAPLVPYAEQLLFAPLLAEGKRIIVQNIGGIANCTVFAAPRVPMAFDTGPGNMLMDAACLQLTGKPYDAAGQLAAQGKVDETVLAHLMTDPYLKQQPPKSTGREYFGHAYLQALLSRFTHRQARDWLATLTAFTAHSIVDAYERWVFPETAIDNVIVGGGGTQNPILMQHLRHRLKEISLQTHEDWHIPNQYKEAAAFALLGWATLTGQFNNMPSCTGARHPVVLGSVCWP